MKKIIMYTGPMCNFFVMQQKDYCKKNLSFNEIDI